MLTAFALAAFLSAILLALLTPRRASAHCDTMDGPVVTAAKKALETGNVNLVLLWVPQKDHDDIRAAFHKTQSVRTLSAEARELADAHFFETLVRVHRAGEGAPYTGLKPAGLDLGPAIPKADKAVENGDVESVVKLLTQTTEKTVREVFADVRAKRGYDPNNLDAAMAYVEAYVRFVHLVVGVFDAATEEESES